MKLYEIDWKYKEYNVLNTTLINGYSETNAIQNFLLNLCMDKSTLINETILIKRIKQL